MDELRRLLSQQQREVEVLQRQCEARLAAERRAAASTPHLVQLRKLHHLLNKQRRQVEAMEVLHVLESLERREAERAVGAVAVQNEDELEALLRRHARERQMLETHMLRMQPSPYDALELASSWQSPSLRHSQPPPPHRAHRKLRAGASPYLGAPAQPPAQCCAGPTQAGGGSAGRGRWGWGAAEVEEGEPVGRLAAGCNWGPLEEHLLGDEESHNAWGRNSEQSGEVGQEASSGSYCGLAHPSCWRGNGGTPEVDDWVAWHGAHTRPSTAASQCSTPAMAAAHSPMGWGSPRAAGLGGWRKGQSRGNSPGPLPGVPPSTAQAAGPPFDSADWDVFCTLQQAAQQWYEGLPLQPPRPPAHPSSHLTVLRPWAQHAGASPPPGRQHARHPESPLARRLAQLKGTPLQGLRQARPRHRASSAPPIALTSCGGGKEGLSGSSTPLSSGHSMDQQPEQQLRPWSCGPPSSRGGPSPAGMPQTVAPEANSQLPLQPPPVVPAWDRKQDLLPQLLSLLLSAHTPAAQAACQAVCGGTDPARQEEPQQQQQEGTGAVPAASLAPSQVVASSPVPPGASQVGAASGQQQQQQQQQQTGSAGQLANQVGRCSWGAAPFQEGGAAGRTDMGLAPSTAHATPSEETSQECAQVKARSLSQPDYMAAAASQPSSVAMQTPAAAAQPEQAAVARQPVAAPAEPEQVAAAAAPAVAEADSAPPDSASASTQPPTTTQEAVVAGPAPAEQERQGPAPAPAGAVLVEGKQAGPQGAMLPAAGARGAQPEEQTLRGGSGRSSAAAVVQGAAAAELHGHCQHGRYDEARQLLKEAALPVDVRDPQLNTPLMLACAGGHGRIVKLCLRKGAAIDAQNAAGDSALLLAAAAGHMAVAKHLLEAGASPSIRNGRGVNAGELIANWSRQAGAGAR